MRRNSVLVLLLLLLTGLNLRAAELVRGVRSKLSAGDLSSGAAAVEDYRREKGVDAEYLDAVGWLARGAVMLGHPEIATRYVDELRREIPFEKEDLLIPLGAAIEVESKLRLAEHGRGSALRFLREELEHAQDTALRSRITKNINLISLEGAPAPAVAMAESLDGSTPESTDGKPTLLFLWANWCGDCKAQAAVLESIWKRYAPEGLVLLAPTRLYGTVDGKPATADEERARIAQVWRESYPGLAGVPVIVDTETHVRYGASATPTFALIDREGIVRLYAPTRLTEEDLSRQIEQVLEEEAPAPPS